MSNSFARPHILRVNKHLSLQCGTPSEIVLYVRFFFKYGLSHLNAVLFLAPLHFSTVHPLIFPFQVQSHSSSPPSSSPLCFPTSVSALSLPRSLSLSVFFPFPPPLLPSCFISAVSVSLSTTPCRQCNDAVLAASQIVCPFPPPPPHTSLPPF